jgi:hypothetical protein
MTMTHKDVKRVILLVMAAPLGSMKLNCMLQYGLFADNPSIRFSFLSQTQSAFHFIASSLNSALSSYEHKPQEYLSLDRYNY